MPSDESETTDERLERIELGQEALTTSIGVLADVVAITNTLLVELAGWLKTPPTSDLGDAILALVSTVGDMRLQLHAVGEGVHLLPERVAKAVMDGDIPGRG